mgnify:CR=1 FL=1
MPKKKQSLTPEEQAERFRAEVERLIAAGELSRTEADKALDGLLSKSARTPPVKPSKAKD